MRLLTKCDMSCRNRLLPAAVEPLLRKVGLFTWRVTCDVMIDIIVNSGTGLRVKRSGFE